MSSTDSLTSNLLLEINKSAQEFFRWSDQQIDKIEASDGNFDQTLEEYENNLNQLKENEKQLETLQQQQLVIKQEQNQEILFLKKELNFYHETMRENHLKLTELEEEKENEKNRLENLLKLQKEMYEKREKRLNDLTKGIRLYNFLGLEFEKAENDCMRFSFQQIDSTDPTRVFEFLLLVDQNDRYCLMDSTPSLDENLIKTIVNQLNRDNNISCFVVNMRRAFQKLVLQY
jgi:hypothetical protein